MLKLLRALSQNFIGRAIFAIIGLLILVGFLFVGNSGRLSLAGDDMITIGSEHVTPQQYRIAYQNQLQQLEQRQKRAITNEEAHRLGLDRQVLSRLMTDGILDQEAAKRELAVGNDQIRATIFRDDLFKGASGQFDKARFDELMRENNNLTEAAYVKDQRQLILRQEISDAIVGDLSVPKAMEEAIHRYQSEVRDVEFFVLPPSAAGDIPAPSEAELKKYYDDRSSTFVAPEFRKLVVLAIVPANLVKPDTITDAEAAKRYDEVKALRFVVPEHRTIEQLVFPDAATADAAEAKLAGGTSFATLITDEKKNPADATLGTVTKDDIADKAVAEAAFALPEGGDSKPIKGQFGTVIVHVSKIQPGHQQPLIEVSASLKDELAIIKARTDANAMRDKIEEQRTAGKTLSEAAASVGLKTQTIDAIDATGRGKTHKPVEGLVDGPALLKAAFATEVGSDTEMLRTADGGDVWYEVAGIDAPHALPLAEVKPAVEAGWRADETARRLAGLAEKLVAALDGGKAFAAVATDAGKIQVVKATNVARGGAPTLPAGATTAIFEVPVGKAGSAAEPNHGRIVFKVGAARVPPLPANDPEFVKLMAQVKGGFVDDMVAQYLAQAQAEIGVKINQQALQSALGSDNGS